MSIGYTGRKAQSIGGYMLGLSNKKVQRVKQKFEKNKRGKNSTLSFDDLYRKFADSSLTFVQIAKQVNRTPEDIRQIYSKYFQTIVPEDQKTGHGRRKAITRARHLQKVEELMKGETESAAAILTAKAKVKQIPCQRIYTSEGLMVRYVKIRGKLCYTLVRNKSRLYGKNTICKYYHFPISKQAIRNVEFVILIAKSDVREDFYIFRKSELANFEGERRHHYICDVTTPPIRKGRVTENTTLYENHRNAWHLLKAP